MYKLELLKLILKNIDILSDFIKTELPEIIKDFLNKDLVSENIIESVIKEEFWSRFRFI